MANYSLVIGSKFRPFEYQEMLAPVLLATQAHQQLEESYGELANQAATVESMANAQTDPIAYQRYKDYADNLRNQADELATYGLNPSSRRAILDMRKRYTQEIVPIQDAYNRRKEQAKMQADILAKDPTHIFGRMASTTSLDDYINNKNLDLTLQNYSGALLAKQVSDEAAALAKAARNDPNARTQLRHLLGFNYETIRQNGFSPESVKEAILRSPNASPILTNIVDRVMESSGIADWDYASPEEKQRIWNKALSAASQGLWSAVGQTQYGTVVDDAAKMAAEYNNAVNLAREKYKIEHPDIPDSGEPRRGWNFLETNGDLAAYKAMQDNFTAKGGGLKASYFGKTFVNPIKVYDEVIKAARQAADVRNTSKKISLTDLYESSHGNRPANREAIEAAVQAVKDRYGVSKILSAKEYQNLKDLGYTSNSTFNDFRNDYSRRVNERASQWRHESVNLNETALKERGNTFRGYLGYLEDYDKWDGQAYLMAANGTIGEPIRELSDIGINDKKALKEAELTDVFYSRQVPGMIHSQFGGKEIYTNPNAYGTVAADIVREADALLNMNDVQIKNAVSRMYGISSDAFTAEQARDFVAKNATAKLRDALRGYGKGRTTTDKDI